MSQDNMKFGTHVRALRENLGISLRKFAARVGVSPTYLSKIERNQFEPPAESKILAMAQALGQDGDMMLALGGKIALDLDRIIRQQPQAMARLIRAAEGLNSEDIESLAIKASQMRARG